MSGMNVAARPGDEDTVATPRSASFNSVIDAYVKKEADRTQQRQRDILQSGQSLAHVDPRTPNGVGTAITEGVKALVRGLELLQGNQDVQQSVVTNPGARLAQYAAKTFPKLYRYLDKSAREFTFGEIGSQAKVPNTTAGLTQELPDGRVAIGVRDHIVDLLHDPALSDVVRRNAPRSYADRVTVLPHELNHAVGFARKELTEQPGYPARLDSHGYNRAAENLIGRTRQGEKTLVQLPPRLAEQGLAYRAEAGRAGMVNEPLVQRAAENAARQAGLLTRDEIGHDIINPVAGLIQTLKPASRSQRRLRPNTPDNADTAPLVR